ncbi:type III-B CRISPR module-associated Cmr3 family protein [Staphylospora marina]|uniref:type III-B CRISPR module-associated Cmr3 family protein n=1 Tax=Staphylospora marina TaxID=2490858 RepID=UPI000F5B91A0|nr:type III-B CRISPR module-associated Cmr3 family protein [Staphylospora marina]
MTTWWSWDPLDTLFFRDPARFSAGESGGLAPDTHFPPFASSLLGAVRFALAREAGWDPERPDSWPEWLGGPSDPSAHPDIPAGWDHTGSLRLTGPFLEWKGETLFPAPLFLYGQKRRDGRFRVTRLVPGTPVDCDLGYGLRLPVLKERVEGHALEHTWVTRSGLERVLRGDTPAPEGELFEEGELWRKEPRAGIQRDLRTQRVEKGHLFTVPHIRTVHGLHIRLGVDGIPDTPDRERLLALPLGGEGRFARVTVDPSAPDPLPPAPQLTPDPDGRIRYVMLLLTHCLPDPDGALIREGFSGAPGKLVCAIIGKPVFMSGWDLRRGGSRPQLPLIPAGSAWFFEADADRKADILALHGSRIGRMTAYGLGQMAIGQWKEEVEADASHRDGTLG